MNNLYQKKSVWIFNISRYFEIWFVYDQVTNYLENEASALHSGEKSVKLTACRCQVEQSCSRSPLVHWAAVDQETKFHGTKVLLGENDQITRARHVCQVKQVDSSACPHVKCGQFTLSYSQIHIHLKNRLISCTKYINDNFDKKYNFDSYFTICDIVEFCFIIFDQDSNRDNLRDIWFDLTWQLRVTLDCICNSHDVFTRPLLPEGSSLQVEILFVCLSVRT